MIGLASFFALLAITASQNHHQHGGLFHNHLIGGSGEHAEMGSIQYFYETQGHYMVMKTSNNCYLMSLNAAQQQSVHTNLGMEELEWNMAAMIQGGEDTIAKEALISHSMFVDKLCAHHTLYKVGIVSTKAPMTTTM